jgi:hypothetical protein
MSLIWSGRILVDALLRFYLYIKIPAASSLSYRHSLESLDKSPEIIVVLSAQSYCYCHQGQRT